jgi:hypothetical protein
VWPAKRQHLCMNVCMRRFAPACVWTVCAYACYAKVACFCVQGFEMSYQYFAVLIHFHFIENRALHLGPNFRKGHAKIFYRPYMCEVVLKYPFALYRTGDRGPHNDQMHHG